MKEYLVYWIITFITGTGQMANDRDELGFPITYWETKTLTETHSKSFDDLSDAVEFYSKLNAEYISTSDCDILKEEGRYSALVPERGCETNRRVDSVWIVINTIPTGSYSIKLTPTAPFSNRGAAKPTTGNRGGTIINTKQLTPEPEINTPGNNKQSD